MKRYEVKIYYSGFCSYGIEAEDEWEAIKKGRELDITDEMLSNLEPWKDADTVEEVK